MLVVAFVNSRTEVAATAEKRNGQRKAYTNMPIVIRPNKIAGGLKAHCISDAQDAHSVEYCANVSTTAARRCWCQIQLIGVIRS